MDTIIQVDNIYFYYKPGLEKFFFKVYIFLKVLPIKYFFGHDVNKVRYS